MRLRAFLDEMPNVLTIREHLVGQRRLTDGGKCRWLVALGRGSGCPCRGSHDDSGEQVADQGMERGDGRFVPASGGAVRSDGVVTLVDGPVTAEMEV